MKSLRKTVEVEIPDRRAPKLIGTLHISTIPKTKSKYCKKMNANFQVQSSHYSTYIKTLECNASTKSHSISMKCLLLYCYRRFFLFLVLVSVFFPFVKGKMSFRQGKAPKTVETQRFMWIKTLLHFWMQVSVCISSLLLKTTPTSLDVVTPTVFFFILPFSSCSAPA